MQKVSQHCRKTCIVLKFRVLSLQKKFVAQRHLFMEKVIQTRGLGTRYPLLVLWMHALGIIMALIRLVPGARGLRAFIERSRAQQSILGARVAPPDEGEGVWRHTPPQRPPLTNEGEIYEDETYVQQFLRKIRIGSVIGFGLFFVCN